MVDYIQLMRPANTFRRMKEEFKKYPKLHRVLKLLAKELNVPVLASISTYQGRLNKEMIKNHNYQILESLVLLNKMQMLLCLCLERLIILKKKNQELLL